MVSSTAITVAIIVGVVALGCLMTAVFHLFNRRAMNRHRTDPLHIPRQQFRPRALPSTPQKVFEEHELELLATKVLTSEELQEMLLSRLDNDRQIQCSCSSNLEDNRHVRIDVGEIAEASDCDCQQPRHFFTPDCSVCLVDFTAGSIVRILSCGHYFHKECIDNWLTHHNTDCPVCKTDMLVALDLPPRTTPATAAANFIAPEPAHLP